MAFHKGIAISLAELRFSSAMLYWDSIAPFIGGDAFHPSNAAATAWLLLVTAGLLRATVVAGVTKPLALASEIMHPMHRIDPVK